MSTAATPEAITTRNRALFERFATDVLNGDHPASASSRLCSPSFKVLRPGLTGIGHLRHAEGGLDYTAGQMTGREGLLNAITALRAAFEDCRFDTHELVVDRSIAFARLTISGRHVAPFLGFAPTLARVMIDEIVIVRFRAGRVASFWGIIDEISVLEQLGGSLLGTVQRGRS